MTYQKAFNRCIYHSQKTLSRTYFGNFKNTSLGSLKIHLDKNLFSFQSEINPPPGNPNGLLVPIVIGILLAVVVLLVVIFFIVKRRRSQSKYDPENAQNGEESKQLNPEV